VPTTTNPNLDKISSSYMLLGNGHHCDEWNSLLKIMIFYQHMNAEYNDKNILITDCLFS